ncbi:MAG: SDR family oxidoreductase [Bacteroidales bacterium]|nr:SDR family oxidoreductase [Bacteroidales bacterium]
MKGKTILVTGSTDGIGKQTAIELASAGATVIVHGRNETKAKNALQEVATVSGNTQLDYCYSDLGSIAEIRSMSAALHNKYDTLDVLINNAGVFMKRKETTVDGIEKTFAINHLSYFLVTGFLLDLLKKSKYSRIVNVASQAHSNGIDWDNLQGEKFYEGYDAYSRSKLCNILFSYKLARELSGSDITVNVLHPGVIKTKLLRTGFGFGGSDVSHGAATSVFLASSPDVEGVSGKYFVHSQTATSSKASYDISLQNRLWQTSEELTGYEYLHGE